MSNKTRLVCLLVFAFSCQHTTKTSENSNAKISFRRISASPYIPRVPGSFHSQLVANPAVAEFKGNTYFMFRGQGQSGHDQIGLWTTPTGKANGLDWVNQYPEPIVPVSKKAVSPDNEHVLDPAVLAKGDSLFVYYTGKSAYTTPNHSVCLAVSTDGVTFKKYAQNPLIKEGLAPEIVFHEGLFYLFYQRHNADGGFWEVFVSTSTDGIHFDTAKERKIFGASNKPGSFDQHSVTTIRIVREGDSFYMTYGGCPKYLDYPEAIGLARSTDLINWERYPHNPIFRRGEAGTWDEGALWFPTVRKMQGRYIMWYEGTGTGLGLIAQKAREASKIAREQDYGGYLKTNFSQIGAAVYEGKLSQW